MQQPVTKEKPNTIQRFTTLVATRVARLSAVRPAMTCVKSNKRRRSIRSAKTPPTSVKINAGGASEMGGGGELGVGASIGTEMGTSQAVAGDASNPANLKDY